MFIDVNSMVTIKPNGGHMAGRFGRVEKIRIINHTGDVLVFVAIFDHETGATHTMMFDPSELQRRKFEITSATRLCRDPMRGEWYLKDLAPSLQAVA